ncbi:hypothetical protein DPMN_104648 [Dreissena polymorpha]|uniref:Uncharacterized protein n=1 Tax=Dreissena polymorpha TaxID=45954 RepID=A0A9D4K1A9_DREPO|nr:hypothetical protein DPMN_104648 [Dreissena polymorpha]
MANLQSNSNFSNSNNHCSSNNNSSSNQPSSSNNHRSNNNRCNNNSSNNNKILNQIINLIKPACTRRCQQDIWWIHKSNYYNKSSAVGDDRIEAGFLI